MLKMWLIWFIKGKILKKFKLIYDIYNFLYVLNLLVKYNVLFLFVNIVVRLLNLFRGKFGENWRFFKDL